MKALIFTEGGKQSGLGHIARCSSLYEELENKGFKVEYIINSEKDQLAILKDKHYRITNWLSKEFLENYIKPDNYSIVDSYLASEDVYQLISNLSKKSVFIDDNDRIEYPKGIVVNPSLSAKVNYLQSNLEHIYLDGPKHIILRSPFIKVKRPSLNYQVKEVMITLGGSDIQNLTKKILEILCIDNPRIKFNVVIGSESNTNVVLDSLYTKNVEIYRNATADQMKLIMLKSDFAISGAGQTIYELLATQTPFIPIKVVANQQQNISNLKELKFINTVLEYNDTSFNDKLIFEFQNLLKYESRLELSKKYEAVVDGLGSKRIIEALLSKSSKKDKEYFLRKLQKEDIIEVFTLSNQDYVRRYSINNTEIKWEDHKVWFNNVISSNDNVFYVVTNHTGEFLGQLRYQVVGKSATVSISFCKAIAGKGLSKNLMRESLNLIEKEKAVLEEVIAYVSIENNASIKLFENLGFTLIGSNNKLLKYSYKINQKEEKNVY